jgi:secreted trypsin-like serine protease
MIPKRKKSGSMFVLFLIVLCVVIHDVVGGPADRIERAATSSCGKSQIAKGLSVGGNNTKPHTWPWMVALQKKLPENKSEFFCAGSLITEQHVVSGKDESIPWYSVDHHDFFLSAAHCFFAKYSGERTWPKQVVAWVGKHNLMDNQEEYAKAHQVNDIMVHQDWDFDSDSFDGDLALLLLDEKVDLSHRFIVGVVCLPPSSSSPFIGNGTISGWGVSEWSIANRKRHSVTPNDLNLPAVTNDQCIDANVLFHALVSDRTFCAGFVDQGKSACQGDSGGGLVGYDKSKRSFNLAGIVSGSLYTLDECNVNTYSVFTDVAKYADWINESVEKTKDFRWQEVEFECEMKEEWK